MKVRGSGRKGYIVGDEPRSIANKSPTDEQNELIDNLPISLLKLQ
jgi:hypothetical protein